jgi:hypothetical protein
MVHSVRRFTGAEPCGRDLIVELLARHLELLGMRIDPFDEGVVLHRRPASFELGAVLAGGVELEVEGVLEVSHLGVHDGALPPEELGFVETIRKVRNIYAHDIRFADVSLIQLVKQRNDKSRMIKYLSAIETYVETDLIAQYERDPGFLRYCVIDSTMRFLFYAYHMAVKFPNKRQIVRE